MVTRVRLVSTICVHASKTEGYFYVQESVDGVIQTVGK